MPVRFRRIAPICVGALLLAGCGQEDRPDPAAEAKKPALLAVKTSANVALISIDSLRPDHLHCYGYPKKTSPHIDQLAREGALFENVISSTSWTLPAHACMFTGLADSVHGCTDADRRLNDRHYTLAERLKDTGYATVGFFSGPYLHPVFGLDQGFDTYVDCTSYPQLSDRPAASRETGEDNITNPRVLEEVQHWLSENMRHPFFMFIHMWDVHFDFTPPPPYDTRFDPDYRGNISGRRFLSDPRINKDLPKRDLEHLLALYDGEIAWTDEHVGKIIAELEARGLLDSTVIIVTAGHGTAFFEHGLKGHRNSLFDEVIRIPLIIRYPARIAAGQRHRQQVRMIDLLPTVVDLVGAPWDYRRLMGQSLAPLFAGGKTQRDEPAISELLSRGLKMQSFRRPERKTIWNLELDKGAVYDLLADPGELAPLPREESPTVDAAKQDIMWSRAFLEAFRQRYPQSPKIAGLPAELREKLESLGYAGDELPAESEPAPEP
ncbi:MAG: sulfatase [Phycisphaerae bacterium]